MPNGHGGPYSAHCRVHRFQLAKFGNVKTFFVFGVLPTADANSIRTSSARAFRCAKASKSFPLPCGLFETVISYAVVMIDRLDDHTAAAIRTETPTKHYAACEIPVVYDRSRGALCYFEKTPLWGAAYYRGFRKQIERFLGNGG